MQSNTLYIKPLLPRGESVDRMLIWSPGMDKNLYYGEFKSQVIVSSNKMIGVQLFNKRNGDVLDGGVALILPSQKGMPLIVWGQVCEGVFNRMDYDRNAIRATAEDLNAGNRGYISWTDNESKYGIVPPICFDMWMYNQLTGGFNSFVNNGIKPLYQGYVSAGCGLLPAWAYFSMRGNATYELVANQCIATVCYARNWHPDDWAKRPHDDPEALDAMAQVLTMFALSVPYQDDEISGRGLEVDDWYCDTCGCGRDDCEGKARVALCMMWYFKTLKSNVAIHQWLKSVLRQYIGVASFCETSAGAVDSDKEAQISGHVRATLIPLKYMQVLEPVLNYLEVDGINTKLNLPVIPLEGTGEVGAVPVDRLAHNTDMSRFGVTRSYYSTNDIRRLKARDEFQFQRFYRYESVCWVFSTGPEFWDKRKLHYRILRLFTGKKRGCTSVNLFCAPENVQFVPCDPLPDADATFAINSHKLMPRDITVEFNPACVVRNDTIPSNLQVSAIHGLRSEHKSHEFDSSPVCRIVKPPRVPGSDFTLVTEFN